jgi:hypothetical protein
VISFDWNSLRVGDRVVVHEHAKDLYRLPQRGLVEFVTVRRPINAVGIRVQSPSGSRVLWPTRQEVHAATSGAATTWRDCVPTDDQHAGGKRVSGHAPR